MPPRIEISKRLLMINSVASVATYLLHITVLLWIHRYLLKRISTEEYSLLPVLTSAMAFVPLFTTVLTGGLGRYITEAYALGDDRRITVIVSTMMVPLMGVAILLTVVGGIFTWYVDYILTIAPGRLWQARFMTGLMVLAIVIRLPTAPYGTGLHVRQKYVLNNLISLGTEIIQITLLLSLLLGVSTKVQWMVVASFLSEFSGLVARQVISRRMIPALKFRYDHINWGTAHELMSFGVYNFIAQLASTIRTCSDPIILNKLATPLDVTCFHLGSMALRYLQQGSAMTTNPLLPVITAMHAIGEKERLQNVFLRGGRLALWISLFLAIPLMVYRCEIMTLYVGAKFAAAGTVMALLLTLFPLDYGVFMASRLAYATANVRKWALLVMVMNIANLLISICLVGFFRLGAVGSALGTFIVFLIWEPLFLWPCGCQIANVPLRTFMFETLWPGLLPAAAATLTWMGLHYQWPPGSWFMVGIHFVCGWLVYVVVLTVFCFKEYEWSMASLAISRLRDYTDKLRGVEHV